MSTPRRSIQEMCGCSTKNLGILRRLVISFSFSFSCAICSRPLWKNLNRVAVLQASGANNDNFFAYVHTVSPHITFVSFTERDLSQMGHPFATLFCGDE